MMVGNDSLICPICGSSDIHQSSRSRIVSIPYCKDINFEENYYLCNECFAEGDFPKKNDEKFEELQKGALIDSIHNILDSLSKLGVSNSQIERSLCLPPRTISRWKSGTFSDAALALLRIVATFPWILEVANRGFDRRFADSLLVVQAGKYLASIVNNFVPFTMVGSLNLDLVQYMTSSSSIESEDVSSIGSNSYNNIKITRSINNEGAKILTPNFSSQSGVTYAAR